MSILPFEKKLWGIETEDEKEEEDEEDIVFHCSRCDLAIVRNSREHDECATSDDKEWFCSPCMDWGTSD